MTKKEWVLLDHLQYPCGRGLMLVTLKSLNPQCIFHLWCRWINIGGFVTAKSLPMVFFFLLCPCSCVLQRFSVGWT